MEGRECMSTSACKSRRVHQTGSTRCGSRSYSPMAGQTWGSLPQRSQPSLSRSQYPSRQPRPHLRRGEGWYGGVGEGSAWTGVSGPTNTHSVLVGDPRRQSPRTSTVHIARGRAGRRAAPLVSAREGGVFL
eukprot:scaffold112372_cov31-Tisochrysis_lutea.AAC.1